MYTELINSEIATTAKVEEGKGGDKDNTLDHILYLENHGVHDVGV